MIIRIGKSSVWWHWETRCYNPLILSYTAKASSVWFNSCLPHCLDKVFMRFCSLWWARDFCQYRRGFEGQGWGILSLMGIGISCDQHRRLVRTAELHGFRDLRCVVDLPLGCLDAMSMSLEVPPPCKIEHQYDHCICTAPWKRSATGFCLKLVGNKIPQFEEITLPMI